MANGERPAVEPVTQQAVDAADKQPPGQAPPPSSSEIGMAARQGNAPEGSGNSASVDNSTHVFDKAQPPKLDVYPIYEGGQPQAGKWEVRVDGLPGIQVHGSSTEPLVSWHQADGKPAMVVTVPGKAEVTADWRSSEQKAQIDLKVVKDDQVFTDPREVKPPAVDPSRLPRADRQPEGHAEIRKIKKPESKNSGSAKRPDKQKAQQTQSDRNSAPQEGLTKTRPIDNGPKATASDSNPDTGQQTQPRSDSKSEKRTPPRKPSDSGPEGHQEAKTQQNGNHGGDLQRPDSRAADSSAYPPAKRPPDELKPEIMLGFDPLQQSGDQVRPTVNNNAPPSNSEVGMMARHGRIAQRSGDQVKPSVINNAPPSNSEVGMTARHGRIAETGDIASGTGAKSIKDQVDSFVNPKGEEYPILKGVMDNLAHRGEAVFEGLKDSIEPDPEVDRAMKEGRVGDALGRMPSPVKTAKDMAVGLINSVKTLGGAVKTGGTAIGDSVYYALNPNEPGAAQKVRAAEERIGGAAVDLTLETVNIVQTIDGARGMAPKAAGVSSLEKGAVSIADGAAERSTTSMETPTKSITESEKTTDKGSTTRKSPPSVTGNGEVARENLDSVKKPNLKDDKPSNIAKPGDPPTLRSDNVKLTGDTAGTGGVTEISAHRDQDGTLHVTISGELKVSLPRGDPHTPNYNKEVLPARCIGLSDYEAAHLWGPGFGDEARDGLMYAPREVNQAFQNRSIEGRLRELSFLARKEGAVIKVSAKATSHPLGTWKGHEMLKNVSYHFDVKLPDGTIRSIGEVDISVGRPTALGRPSGHPVVTITGGSAGVWSLK